MRFVDRRAIAPPPSLMGPNSPASRELESAARHFSSTPEKEFKFSVYSADDVRYALNQLFRGKCAYCEAPIQATQPTDVEHFRPKGRIQECPEHPGYWWLAATWENLLSSCIDCNRRRYHDAQELEGGPLPNEKDGRFILGKGDFFPILGPVYAQSGEADHDKEDAALIDPTRRDPRLHLRWIVEEGKNLIGPVEANGQVDPYGHHTYQVFGLNRQGLVEQRTALWLRIQNQLVLVKDMLEIGVTEPDPAGQRMRDLAFSALEKLTDYTMPGEPYSAMVKELLAQETETLMAKYAAYCA